MPEGLTSKLDPLAHLPTVLVVDDDPAVLSALTRVLRALQIQVRVAPDGAQALAWITAGGRPAVVISDYSMPGMTGLQLLGEVERRVPKAFRILHTGESRVALELSAGTVITVVAKPSDAEFLRQLVGAVLSVTVAPAAS